MPDYHKNTLQTNIGLYKANLSDLEKLYEKRKSSEIKKEPVEEVNKEIGKTLEILIEMCSYMQKNSPLILGIMKENLIKMITKYDRQEAIILDEKLH